MCAVHCKSATYLLSGASCFQMAYQDRGSLCSFPGKFCGNLRNPGRMITLESCRCLVDLVDLAGFKSSLVMLHSMWAGFKSSLVMLHAAGRRKKLFKLSSHRYATSWLQFLLSPVLCKFKRSLICPRSKIYILIPCTRIDCKVMHSIVSTVPLIKILRCQLTW
jgi:hypothetical protein